MTAERIPEVVVPGKRLGRHVYHDARSLAYLVEPDGALPESHHWPRYTAVLDQGNLGSCTGNAITGILGTAPFYGSLLAKRRAGLKLDEGLAVSLYSAATVLDPWPGSWEPDDTGSDGLSACKAAQTRELIGAYLHITSLEAAHTAIKTGPFIMGCNWYSGMDNPDHVTGLVVDSGTVRGGHEFEVVAYSAVTGLWRAVNSWGSSFGINGRFSFSDATMERLLAEQGDATVPTKIAG